MKFVTYRKAEIFKNVLQINQTNDRYGHNEGSGAGVGNGGSLICEGIIFLRVYVCISTLALPGETAPLIPRPRISQP